MDFRQLSYFVRVAELGNMSRAAAALGVTQPMLSRHMRRLEQDVGKPLLTRHGHGVRPTAAGRQLLEHGKGILHQVELARAALTSDDERAGRVVIGLPPSICRHVTVPLVDAFRRTHPEASLGIVEGMTVAMQEWLAAGRLDGALLHDPAPLPGLDYETLWSEDLCLVSAARRAPQSARITLAALAGYPLILPSRPNAVRRLIDAAAAQAGITLDVALDIDAIPSVVDLVAAGHGHAVLSRIALASWSRARGLHATPIVRPALTGTVVLATRRDRPLTPLVRATLELIRADIAPDVRRLVRGRH